jgi:hypothetical protein
LHRQLAMMNSKLALAAGLLFSMVVFAESSIALSECKVDARAAVFLENGPLYKSGPISDGKFQSFESTWEDCYKFAMGKAESLPRTLDLVVSGRRIQDGQQNATGYVYFVWTFDDGSIWKLKRASTGMLTAATAQVIKAPQTGDVRLLEDGTRFE